MPRIIVAFTYHQVASYKKVREHRSQVATLHCWYEGVHGQEKCQKLTCSRDDPIPSIEAVDPVPYASTALVRARYRTPSVSLTPPPSSEDATSRSDSLEVNTNFEQDGSRDSITNRLANVRITNNVDTSQVAPAIHSDHGENEATLLPERASRRSRRSSSIRPPHVVENEVPTSDVFNQVPIQRALEDARTLAATLATALSSGTIHTDANSYLHRLHTEALECADFRNPSTRTIGFVGESGAGKSSLLNSLLDRKDFLRSVSQPHPRESDLLHVTLTHIAIERIRNCMHVCDCGVSLSGGR